MNGCYDLTGFGFWIFITAVVVCDYWKDIEKIRKGPMVSDKKSPDGKEGTL